MKTMYILTIVFIAYEVFKLVTLKQCVEITYRIVSTGFTTRPDHWQVYVNLLYLVYMIALAIIKPWVGIPLCMLSVGMSILVTIKPYNRKTLTVLTLLDTGGSLGILVGYLLGGG